MVGLAGAGENSQNSSLLLEEWKWGQLLRDNEHCLRMWVYVGAGGVIYENILSV